MVRLRHRSASLEGVPATIELNNQRVIDWLQQTVKALLPKEVSMQLLLELLCEVVCSSCAWDSRRESA